MATPEQQQDESSAQHRTLRAMGITVLGVVLSISATVGFGLTGVPWWLRALAAVAVGALLLFVIKAATNQGAHGPVARAADWLTGQSEDSTSR